MFSKRKEATVITTGEATPGRGCYHLQNTEETGSICGAVSEENFFAGRTHAVLPRAVAEQRGLTLCRHCSTISDNRVDTET